MCHRVDEGDGAMMESYTRAAEGYRGARALTESRRHRGTEAYEDSRLVRSVKSGRNGRNGKVFR